MFHHLQEREELSRISIVVVSYTGSGTGGAVLIFYANRLSYTTHVTPEAVFRGHTTRFIRSGCNCVGIFQSVVFGY